MLLNGLILEGKSFIEKLNGFFAFCFYDKVKNYYLLARDRFGIKPLLYSHQENQFIFSSELKSLMCYPISKELDQIALNQFLQFTYIPSPRTILQNGKKLQPGHLIEIENKKVSIEKYFTYYPCEKSTDDYETAQKKVKDLLNKAVQEKINFRCTLRYIFKRRDRFKYCFCNICKTQVQFRNFLYRIP